MNDFAMLRLAGRSALVNAVAGVVSLIALTIFFSIGGPWGKINDSASVVWALAFLPLVLLFYEMHKPFAGAVSLAAALIGATALLLFVALQGLLVVNAVSFTQTVRAVLFLTALIGVWQLVNGILAWATQSLPATPVAFLLLSGISYVLVAVGFMLGGQEHPLAAAGFLVGGVAGPVWAIWLGRVLLWGDATRLFLEVKHA